MDQSSSKKQSQYKTLKLWPKGKVTFISEWHINTLTGVNHFLGDSNFD